MIHTSAIIVFYAIFTPVSNGRCNEKWCCFLHLSFIRLTVFLTKLPYFCLATFSGCWIFILQTLVYSLYKCSIRLCRIQSPIGAPAHLSASEVYRRLQLVDGLSFLRLWGAIQADSLSRPVPQGSANKENCIFQVVNTACKQDKPLRYAVCLSTVWIEDLLGCHLDGEVYPGDWLRTPPTFKICNQCQLRCVFCHRWPV